MADEYAFISVPRKSNNSGRATGKKGYIVLFRWDDVATFTKDAKGVRVTAFTFAESKKPIAVYTTQSTINIYDTAEGDPDARGFIHHVDFEHPGSEVEFKEFLNNNVNENLGAIVINCAGDDCKIAGTPCTQQRGEQDHHQHGFHPAGRHAGRDCQVAHPCDRR